MKKVFLILIILIFSFLPNFQILAAELPTPEILIYPEIYLAGEEILYLEGKALPNSKVILSLKKDNLQLKIWEVSSDENGNWIFSTNELFKSGNYQILSRTKDVKGTLSNFSPEYQIKVVLAGLSFGSRIITYQNLLLILIILALTTSFFSIYLILSRLKKARAKLKKETREAAESLKNTFNNLRKDLEKKIEYFDSKPGLSPEERKLRDEIMIILRNSEEQVRKEIKDIEKELH